MVQQELTTQEKTMQLDTKESKELAPQFPQEYAGIGDDDLDDVVVPLGYTKVIQKMSPEFDQGLAKIGEFYDTSNQRVLGQTTNIVVVKKVTDWACFNDDKNVRYSNDGMVWNNGEELTQEETWKNKRLRFYVINPDEPDIMPSILVIKGASRKSGDYITSTLKRFSKINKEPVFSRSFKLSNSKQTKDTYTFQVISAALNEGFNSKDLMAMAFEARKVAEAHCSIYSAEDDITVIKDGQINNINNIGKEDDL